MTAETVTDFPYERNPQSLPDQNGTLTGVGDWVVDDEMNEWRVIGLCARAEHAPNNPSRKTGNVDRLHSYFSVARYRRHGDGGPLWTNLEGEVQTGRTLMRVTRLDLTGEERLRRDLERVDIFLSNVGVREADLADRRRRAESLRAQLLARITQEVPT